MSAASTATKPTNEKTADAAPSSGEKPAAAKLEEDDEFEDFPAEGKSDADADSDLADPVSTCRTLQEMDDADDWPVQTGRRRTRTCRVGMRICGRRAGMMMKRTTISRRS